MAETQPTPPIRAPGPNDGPSQPGASQLVELLERQRSLYHRLRTLAERQKSLVVCEDVQPLLRLLADRQRLVDELMELNKEMSEFRRNWSSIYGSLDGASRKRVARLLEEANSALGLILRSDSRDTATLSAKRQDVATRLASIDSGSRVSAAYAAAGAGMRAAMTDAKG
ncbi:MAG: hypothetical protein ABII12_15060 [Planctomycetota bacterium]